MKIFLDFDDSLFDTKRFVSKLVEIFLKNGVSKNDFFATYRDYPQKTVRGLQKYDPCRQIKYLESSIGVCGEKIKSDLENFVSDTSRYVFRDVDSFFSNFRRNNLYIVSFGHTGFQEKKIKNSGLRKRIRNIAVTDRSKAEIIKRFANGKEKFVFIDDRTDQIRSVKKYFPNSATFLLKRKEGRYNSKKTKAVDFEVKNLTEAKKIIKKICDVESKKR